MRWKFDSAPLEIWFCSQPSCKAVIAVKFGTCHDSQAVVACAKFCSNISFNVVTLKQIFHSRSRRDVMRLSNKRSPYLFGVATANRTKVTTPNKYGAEIIARMSDWENCKMGSWTCIDSLWPQGSKLRGAEGQNAPKLSPNAPRLLNLGAKFCYPIQPDICFEV